MPSGTTRFGPRALQALTAACCRRIVATNLVVDRLAIGSGPFHDGRGTSSCY